MFDESWAGSPRGYVPRWRGRRNVRKAHSARWKDKKATPDAQSYGVMGGQTQRSMDLTCPITQLASEGDSFNSTAHAPVIDHDNGLEPSPKRGGHKNGTQIFRGPRAEGYGQSFVRAWVADCEERTRGNSIATHQSERAAGLVPLEEKPDLVPRRELVESLCRSHERREPKPAGKARLMTPRGSS